MNIILYSTDCPKCKVLKANLKEKNISYVENNNVDEMLQKGFEEVPVLEVAGETYNFVKAMKWVGEH